MVNKAEHQTHDSGPPTKHPTKNPRYPRPHAIRCYGTMRPTTWLMPSAAIPTITMHIYLALSAAPVTLWNVDRHAAFTASWLPFDADAGTFWLVLCDANMQVISHWACIGGVNVHLSWICLPYSLVAPFRIVFLLAACCHHTAYSVNLLSLIIVCLV
jgi:hypothetical protein